MHCKKNQGASCRRLGGVRVATLQRHAQAKSRGFSGVRVVLETRRNSINISICSFCFWRWIRTARTFQPTKFQCRESNIEKKNPQVKQTTRSMAQERVVPAKHIRTRLFFANVHESGTIGSGSASSAQNCPRMGWTTSGCRAMTCFVPSERREPHVCSERVLCAEERPRNARGTRSQK